MNNLENAKYGAANFEADTTRLPAIFPRTMGPNCGKYVQEVIDSGLTVDMVGRFEKAFADAMGVKHCIGTPGCTNALHILAASLEFEAGSEIIVSPIADYGTVMGLIRENFIPVFCDTEPGSPNISANTIKPCINKKTKAVLIVHKLGLPCEMDPIVELAQKNDLLLLEDTCQSLFSEYNGRLTGTFGEMAAYSFDSEKSMGADIGGCVTTNNDEWGNRLRYIGQSRGAKSVPGFGRIHFDKGLALRIPQCTAATCLGQLEIIEEQVRNRDKTARLLTEKLKDVDGIIPLHIPDYCTIFSCWMYGFTAVPEKLKCSPSELAEKIKAKGLGNIGMGKYYLMPDALVFLRKQAMNKIYPFSIPGAPGQEIYDGSRQTPNAKTFLDNFIRWAWTEKYTEKHVDIMYNIIKKVVTESLK
ncbi:MAG: DegT/DnrJ/EryC1/StrS family aminotransferase [Victivallaceae bacterium]|nr:DegT/DnrJ/EryC1/StrS family aminotransferase [Victivallaceae bacterium]